MRFEAFAIPIIPSFFCRSRVGDHAAKHVHGKYNDDHVLPYRPHDMREKAERDDPSR